MCVVCCLPSIDVICLLVFVVCVCCLLAAVHGAVCVACCLLRVVDCVLRMVVVN